MSLVGQPERATQNRVIALFREELDYLYLGDWSDRDGNSNVEEGLHRARTIRLNTELAKKPAGCLEYIVVHELVHLLEPTHNARFVTLMDRFMTQWRFHREALNSLPLRRESWSY